MAGEQTCIICEGQASFFMNHPENKLDYYKCSRCHSGFSLPEKSNKIVSEFYNSQYYNKCNEHFDKHREIFLKNLEDISFNEFEKELKGEKKCLDLGCANGNFLELMYHRKWKIYGIDQKDCVNKKINALGEFKCKNILEKVDSWKNTFDLVHCCHVIEHINYPSKVIDTIHHYLKPQGRTIIIAPNLSGLESSLNYPASLVDPTHVVNYSLKGLILLLSKSRFRILDYITWGGFRQSRMKQALLPLLKELDMGDVFLVYAEKI